jgi:L,D-peptidoglycan transpeptidase YkuD (ErfK/YbiS/YcfS/YnhG family)
VRFGPILASAAAVLVVVGGGVLLVDAHGTTNSTTGTSVAVPLLSVYPTPTPTPMPIPTPRPLPAQNGTQHASATPTHSNKPSQSTPPTHSLTPTRSASPAPAQSQSSASNGAAQRLPLGYSTGSATRVLTYVATSYSSTSGTLQAWNKVAGHWVKHGLSMLAWGGSDGLTKHMSEFRSATQVGSFTLTQAFGRLANPGTELPYLKTQPDDWWISQSGPLYNTHQRCASHCSFTLGAPNEHLYYETPDYDYAVVINIDTSPAVYPDGSAVFLHVTENKPTAGCISIPAAKLVPIMGWLDPSTHPRILIGVS